MFRRGKKSWLFWGLTIALVVLVPTVLLVRQQTSAQDIHLWAQLGAIQLVEHELSKGENVNRKGPAGWTPLHYAVVNHQKEMVEFLLSHGADVDARATLGDTPLYHAVRLGKKDIVDLLLNNGADPNIATRFGRSPLERARGDGHKAIEETLRNHGAHK